MASEQKQEAPDNRLQVTICGGGNGSHAFVVTVASKFSPRYKVNWLSLYADEADKINAKLAENDGYIKGVFVQENAIVSGKPNVVSKDPAKVIPNSDIIILCVPAFAHTEYLDVINKHHEICQAKNKEELSKLNKKLIIAAFPSACGLEFAFKKMISNYEDNVVLFNCLTLPWACRIIEYGISVELLGIKSSIGNYIAGSDKLIQELEPLKKLQSIFLDGKPVLECDSTIHICSSSLGSMNPVIHSSIMYNQWSDYDGSTAFEKKPLFYHGVDAKGAKLMSELSDEVMAIAAKFNELGANIQTYRPIRFPHVKDWYVQSYGEDCSDPNTLQGLLNTNPGYNGLTHPMKPSKDDANKYVPNFGYRYLTEDIPFGLIVTKAMACMLDDADCGIKTPNLDKVVLWAEKVMNRKYFIVDSKDNSVKLDLKSKDIEKARIPQNFGFSTIDDILKF